MYLPTQISLCVHVNICIINYLYVYMCYLSTIYITSHLLSTYWSLYSRPCSYLLKNPHLRSYDFPHLNSSKGVVLCIFCLSHFTQLKDASGPHNPPLDGTSHPHGEDSNTYHLLRRLNPVCHSLHNIKDTSLMTELHRWLCHGLWEESTFHSVFLF